MPRRCETIQRVHVRLFSATTSQIQSIGGGTQAYSVAMLQFVKSLLYRGKAIATLSEPLKMVLIVRNDLGMSKGKTGAQCAHAAIMCYEQCLRQQPALANAWLHLGQPKVVLRANSLKELDELSKAARKANVVHGVVRDAGRTQVAAGTVTVLGIGPDTISNIDALAKHLRLL